MTLISPLYRGLQTSMCIHYDSNTSQTLVYFNCFDFKSAFATFAMTLERMKATASLAEHPLFLPLLYYQNWVEYCRIENDNIYAIIEQIQTQVGILDYSRDAPSTRDFGQVELAEIHRKIVRVHNNAVNSLPTFVKALGACLRTSLDTLDALNNPRGEIPHRDEMEAFYTYLQDAMEIEAGARTTHLQRISMQHTIVSRQQLTLPALTDQSQAIQPNGASRQWLQQRNCTGHPER